MPRRPLGRTGFEVGLLGLGGLGLLTDEQRTADAIRLVQKALDLGVNYIDTADAYGPSERHIGQAIRERRKEVFLATRTQQWTASDVLRAAERSLDALQTDQIDLLQLANPRSVEEVDFLLRSGGALEGLLAAKQRGLIRFAGLEGHSSPDAIRYAIERFPCDCVLFPANPFETHDGGFLAQVLPAAAERQIGVIGMKVLCHGFLLSQAGFSVAEAVRYSLSHPVSGIIIGHDTLEELEENAAAARQSAPLDAKTLALLEERAKPFASELTRYRAH